MLLAVPYLLGAILCTAAIADGGPGWPNLLVIVFIWNAMKFLILGPVSLTLLAHAGLGDTAARRNLWAMIGE